MTLIPTFEIRIDSLVTNTKIDSPDTRIDSPDTKTRTDLLDADTRIDSPDVDSVWLQWVR